MASFRQRLAGYMAFRFMRIAKGEARSKSIADSLHLVRTKDGVGVESPFYWSIWYHDGRGPVRARPGRKLVYFRDPSKDPRLLKGYPATRQNEVRRLTKAEFYKFLKDPSSGMVIADSVGPWTGDPFFKRAGDKFKRAEAGQIARQRTSEEMRKVMGDLLNVTERLNVRLPRLR